MSSEDTATRAMYKSVDARAPVVPDRLREPIKHHVDDAMPAKFAADVGLWLHNNKDKFVRGGDDEGVSRFNYELTDVDNYTPVDMLTQFKQKLIATATSPEVLDALCVPEFDLRFVETHATLYHHGSHFDWHDDAPGPDGDLVPSRRISFCYYMHADPKMFSGGELEFLDGSTVEPKNNRLSLFHPMQQHRVRRVECWSSQFLHGRWALMGWLHGDAPEGWVNRLPKLRGRPNNRA